MNSLASKIDPLLFRQIQPKSGWRDLLTVYVNWSGVGFVSVWVADHLDRLSGTVYAAHYTDAVNAAIGVNFWLLISSIGLLLYCLALPMVYLLNHYQQYAAVSQRLRFFTYMFFLVAFDEGALMVGILLANMLDMSDRAELIVSKSFLFSQNNIAMLTLMIAANSLLWLLGESIYNRQDKSYSGIVAIAINSPLKFSAPAYLLLTATLVFFIVFRH